MKTTTTERVQKMMKDLGDLDQPTFGALCGASKSVVNQWLSGEIKTIGAKYAFKLQKRTGYNAEWIQLGEGNEKIGEQRGQADQISLTPPSNLSPSAQQLIERITRMDLSHQSPPALYALIENALDLVQPTADSNDYAGLNDL